MQELTAVPRGNILGVGVSAINMPQALQAIEGWMDARTPQYVCVTPAHAVMECHDHPEIKSIYNQSGLTTPDGMSIVWLLKLFGFPHVDRVYGPDLMLEVCRSSQDKGYKHYFYGGAPGVADQLAKKLLKRFPELKIVGLESPPFRELTDAENQEMIKRIQSAAPDIIWVGIGSPRQEKWMSRHLKDLGVPVLIGVGAAFDFLSGNKPQAPRWVQRSGMEWFYRLLSEPRRLWKRYMLNYPRFIVLVCMQLLGIRKFNMD